MPKIYTLNIPFIKRIVNFSLCLTFTLKSSILKFGDNMKKYFDKFLGFINKALDYIKAHKKVSAIIGGAVLLVIILIIVLVAAKPDAQTNNNPETPSSVGSNLSTPSENTPSNPTQSETTSSEQAESGDTNRELTQSEIDKIGEWWSSGVDIITEGDISLN